MTQDIFPSVEGWLSDAELTELQRLARGVDVLEIGCWKARSTVALSHVARHVWSIDTFTGDDWTGRALTLPEALQNLIDSGVRDRVSLLCGDVRDLLPVFDPFGFGLMFYDAAHDYETTAWALRLFHQRSGFCGSIAVHDYDHNSNHAGVRRAVDEFCDRVEMAATVVDRLAVIEVTK